MKKLLITLLAACGMAFLACSAVSAMPGNPASIPDTMKTGPVEPVRLYCYSRSTGQFLHWGAPVAGTATAITVRIITITRIIITITARIITGGIAGKIEEPGDFAGLFHFNALRNSRLAV